LEAVLEADLEAVLEADLEAVLEAVAGVLPDSYTGVTHNIMYLFLLCPDKSGITVFFHFMSLNFGAIFFFDRSFVLRSRNLEIGQ